MMKSFYVKLLDTLKDSEMNYALYQYINRDGVVSHALVNTVTKAVMLADTMIYGERGASGLETCCTP